MNGSNSKPGAKGPEWLEEKKREISEVFEPADPKVTNLTYYRLKKSLNAEGFDVVTNDRGRLTLVLRLNI